MLVRNWMTEQVELARPEDDVATVRARLHDRRVRQLPVVSAGQLVGIITDRDVRSAHDPAAKVEGIMTRDPVTTTPATLVEDAAALLRGRKIGALPVVDKGALVGIVSESDLLQALVELCRVVEPTTLLEVDCQDGMRGGQRVRSVLERHGGIVPWMSAVTDPSGRMRVTLRVRMPIGHAPEQILEEAGFVVLSCITGRPSTTAPAGSDAEPR